MPPVKKKQEETSAITTVGSDATQGEFTPTEPGVVEKKEEKQSLPLIIEFEQSLLRLGIDLATGMYDKTRFPSAQEVAGLDALCKLYGTLKGYNATR